MFKFHCFYVSLSLSFSLSLSWWNCQKSLKYFHFHLESKWNKLQHNCYIPINPLVSVCVCVREKNLKAIFSFIEKLELKVIRNNRNQTLTKLIQITVRMSVWLAGWFDCVRCPSPVASYRFSSTSRKAKNKRESEREREHKDVALHERP